jgi:hypothetical protein
VKRESVRPEFVEFIPSTLEDGVLYLSIEFASAVHLCCCGCGSKVVTPLSRTDWALIFEGDVVSLTPSIGNWSFPCQSHYWIRQNRVRWASRMTPSQIEAGRRRDRERTDRYFTGGDDVSGHEPKDPVRSRLGRVWDRIKALFVKSPEP